MPRTGSGAGPTLAAGLLLAAAASLAPAGLHGEPPPVWSWPVWASALLVALSSAVRYGPGPAGLFRRLALLLPLIALLILPAALLAPPAHRPVVAVALAARALSAAAVAVALAARLGPSGFVAGLRALRAPERFVAVVADALAGQGIVLRQVARMLRAREARRPTAGAWSPALFHPVETARGFGRLTAVLLLRSMERAESVDRARRARGAGDRR